MLPSSSSSSSSSSLPSSVASASSTSSSMAPPVVPPVVPLSSRPYIMGGVEVYFPIGRKPYPPQMAVMAKVTNSIKRRLGLGLLMLFNIKQCNCII